MAKIDQELSKLDKLEAEQREKFEQERQAAQNMTLRARSPEHSTPPRLAALRFFGIRGRVP
ncbi:MAG: hypothetical protein JOZ19_06550 [Rubrobacter sp.]|nr:hypothetical protein [Rubrobacter sp.]